MAPTNKPIKKSPMFKLNKRYKKWSRKPAVKAFRVRVTSTTFLRVYLLLAVVILLATTVLWAVLGATLQQQNADQLVNAYLFQNSATFHGALFPEQHSFLLKWPLFYLFRLTGYSSLSFILVTLGSVLATVGILAFILHRIERRRLVFATICLALASVMLLVPTQPYAGALLPVSMAMLTTRNLEYVLYIAGVVSLVGATSVRNKRFILSVLLLTLLIASDKLFMTIGLGGALVALVSYAAYGRWNLVSFSVRWVAALGAATVAATAVLAGITALKITHFSQTSGLGPYGIAKSLKDLVMGSIYALSGMLTNSGANPGYDAVTLKEIPIHGLRHLASPAGIGYLVNLIIFVGMIYASYRIMIASVTSNRKRTIKEDTPFKLSVVLIWSAFAAGVVFVFSQHYYPVDARYLTISFFALFVASTTYISKKRWQPEQVMAIGALAILGISSGVVGNLQTYHIQKAALKNISQRNQQVSQAMVNHHVNVLVGDYWRVLPTRQISKKKLNVVPLQNCTTPREVLSSKVWSDNFTHKSFAYLLSFDKSLTDYPACSLTQVIGSYGRPNASYLVSGTLDHPIEVLLFYDNGTHIAELTSKENQLATVLPIPPEELPYTHCSVPTIMNIVAHQDDDLLFMNPDIQNSIAAGHCVRTIYLTAGDAGSGKSYWLAREHGSESAYSAMLGTHDVWTERIVKLGDHQYATVANPHKNSRVSLIFMHLPDGGIHGNGFKNDGYQSLEKLDKGQINAMDSIDNQSYFSSKELESGLTSFMHLYQPAEVRTQSNYVGMSYPDHSDHMAVGRFAQRAYQAYENEQFENRLVVPTHYYIGYPIHELPINLSAEDQARKLAIFLEYAKYDGGVCQSKANCDDTPTYGSYLNRQYQNAN